MIDKKSVAMHISYALVAVPIAYVATPIEQAFFYNAWLPTLIVISVINIGIVSMISLTLRLILVKKNINVDRSTGSLRMFSVEQGILIAVAAVGLLMSNEDAPSTLSFAGDAIIVYTIIATIFNEVDLRDAVITLLPESD